MTSPLLEADEVTKRYGATLALDRVSLEVAPGEVVALVGENGAGKSTLVRILSGTEAPDSGAVSTDQGPLPVGDPRAAQEAGIAVIHQELTYVGTMSVAENLVLGRFPARRRWLLDRRRMSEMASDAMADIDPGIDIGARLDRLSVGARQLVEIARAVASSPRVLLLDEPTAALSTEEAERLFAVIARLKARGIGMVYISHRLKELAVVADRTVVLRDGEVVARHPAGVDRATVVEDIVGRRLRSARERHEAPPSRPAGDAYFATREVSSGRLEGLDLDVHAGEVIGLYGLPGSGVEDVAYAIVGDGDATGTVRIGETSYGSARSPVKLRRGGFAVVPADRRDEGLFAEESLAFNVAIGPLTRGSFVRRTRASADLAVTREQIANVAIRPPDPKLVVDAMSGGNQQKSIFARWLAIEPRVLVLDQPTRGVDVGAKAQIYELIERIAADGTAVLIVSPEPEELLTVCDHIGIIHQGALTAFASTATLDEDTLVAAAISGEEP